MLVRFARRGGVAAVLVSLVVPGPSSALAGQPRAVEAVRIGSSAARDAMQSGRLAEVLAVAGIRSTARAETRSVGVVDGVPAPIATLDRVIRRASDRIRAMLPPAVARRSLGDLTLRAMAGRPVAPPNLAPAARSTIRHAAGSVAAAIDVLLPQIVALPPTATAGERVAGCDVHDAAPDLCVASDADNVLARDYALVVDLGGDDTHTHSAGGATPGDNGLVISVTIDVEGADVYDAPVPTGSGSYLSQGAAYVGAGFLVDAAGDDRYRIATNEPLGRSIGQGKGWHGVGVLADFGGDDRYELSANGAGPQYAVGQGEAINGVGVLLDAAGDDVHTVRAISTDYFDGMIGPFVIQAPPVAGTSGIGSGSFGFLFVPITIGPLHADLGITARHSHGLFLDGGGTDVLELRSEVLDPRKDAYLGRPWIAPPAAVSVGIGYGYDTGHGTVVLGDGRTEASMLSSARAPRAETVTFGLGYGMSFGVGTVADGGGDDVWRMSSENVVERRGSLDPGCSCPPPASASTRETRVIGLGYGELSGVGMMEDAGGNDRYLASATNTVDTELVERPGDPASNVRSSATAGAVRVAVQGVADLLGVGMLHDGSGDDRYEIAAASAARARLSGPPSGNGEASSVSGDTTVLAQAAARGVATAVLRDNGGSDTYVTASTNLAEAEPPTEVTAGVPVAAVLASVDSGSSALFVDADGGAADSFSATPAIAACVGTRGQAQWVDCGGAGIGTMA